MVKKSKFVAPAIEPASATDRWRIVSLGDVVVHRQEQERNPESAGFERYLMVDHLDADRLKISRWGAIEGGDLPPTFYKVFRSGQVLYPTRNPHLRRVAYADFDGICGEKTLTLESNGEIEPRLLPFVFQTDRFIEHAKSMAIGSTNPHVRWRDIAAYEFPLPPKDEQRRIADILWAADEAVTQKNSALSKVEDVLQAFLCDAFTSRAEDEKQAFLQELCAESITYGIVQAGPHIPDGVPYIRVSDMVSEAFVIDSILRTAPQIAARFRRSTVKSGDIVFALRGAPGLVRVVPEFLDGANLTQGTARISVRADVNRDFVLWALRSPMVRKQIATEAKGSTFKEITLASIRKLRILDKARNEQDQIADCANSIYARMEETKTSCADAMSLYAELRNSMLSVGIRK